MTAVDLDALDKLRAAATPGPWRKGGSGIVAGLEYVVFGIRTDPDAALIVAAVNALPDLIAEVRKYRALREAVDGLIAFYDRHEYSTLDVDDLRSVVATVDGEQ